MPEVDYIEVSRMVHELSNMRGAQVAFAYAMRQAERSVTAEKPTEQAFWEAVAASLKPR
jgi:hypothetical protein